MFLDGFVRVVTIQVKKSREARTIINSNWLTLRSEPVGRSKLPFSDKSLKSQKRDVLKFSRENEHDSSLIEDVISRITIGKQFLKEAEGSQDSSIFSTMLIPLRLTTSNLTPQSLRFCRSIKLQYAKETKEHIMNEKNNLGKKIQNLKPFDFTVNGCQVIVDFHLCLTLIDAKFFTITDFMSDIFRPKESPLH
ncbi:unnamed protein product [Psylliodes chrysocephalus]|uniref:Uncharacterized protein n=1 Tax=Psylliodes chrysocephalus TaxID=3402493 RepID=A0A9P0GAQ3_9CUCU|nr:unnamed protein product [Psylliodes chrysocephala]